MHAGAIEQRARDLAEALDDDDLAHLADALSLASRCGASPFRVPPGVAILRQVLAREARLREQPVAEKVAGW